MTITDDQIQDIALAAGFTLKPQPDGGMALHPHVFEFARAMISAGQHWRPPAGKASESLDKRPGASPGANYWSAYVGNNANHFARGKRICCSISPAPSPSTWR